MSQPDTFDLRVRRMTWEADGVLSLELVRPDGAPLPACEAGAHLDLHLPTATGPQAGTLAGTLVRSYSLAGRPGETGHYLVGVGRDRASRGGSRWVHEQLRPGQVLKATGPRNHFRLNEAAPRVALVAGGIGVTPILAMAQRLAATGKPVQMLYAVRSRAAAAWLAELQALVPSLTLHVDSEAGGPPDVAGWLAALPKDTGCYCCGPAPMLDAFERAAAALGLADAHIERFAAAPPPPGAPAPAASAACTVHLQRSGRQVDVPAGTSILQAILDAGIDMPYSCMEGLCGTCETRVLQGSIDHRDSVLSTAERAAGKVMMVCVSACTGPTLVLDA